MREITLNCEYTQKPSDSGIDGKARDEDRYLVHVLTFRAKIWRIGGKTSTPRSPYSPRV